MPPQPGSTRVPPDPRAAILFFDLVLVSRGVERGRHGGRGGAAVGRQCCKNGRCHTFVLEHAAQYALALFVGNIGTMWYVLEL